jgi:hypothetical protein
MSDPFYRRMLAGLDGRLDPDVFQACVNDLLRDTFPGLVPISGGGDAGMDGAIADGRGEAFSLVCTTAKNVIGNLSTNLDSYLKSGGGRRRVVLATSQALTPPRRRNLEARAREKGFILVQVVERRGVADRLYRSPRWCRELLGLAGTPPALSVVPRTRRPLLEIALIGREGDLEWMRTTTGDRLISGHPGSGKTYLLHQLVREGWGLFLVSEDLTEIADALREQRPARVIVDDAHRDPDLLERLRHLREENGESFEIIATSWEGERERVAEALGPLPAARTHRLELLTRAQILEVIQQVGILGPEGVLRELVDQASNKPGLAVTLTLLSLRGDWPDVVAGHALRRSLLTVFEDLVGRESTDLLGALGLGGDRGMPVEAVGGYLGLGRQKSRELVAGLAAGGVLSEVRQGVMAVWPRALRSALLRQVFFESPHVLDYKQLLETAPNPDSAALAVVEAAGRGANVPEHALRELVARSRSSKVWQAYSLMGEDQALWAIDHYPGDLVYLAREALLCAPQATIPRLLQRAVGATGPLHSQPNHPIRLLKDWLEELSVAPEEAIRRRRLVARQANAFLKNGGDRSVGIQALLLSLSPKREGLTSHPVEDSVTMLCGLLPLEQLRQIEAIWAEARDAIDGIDTTTWRHLTDALWGWIYPSYAAGREVSREFQEIMHSFAAQVLNDLMPLADGSPGLTAGLKRLAKPIGIELPLKSDPVFELLYPEDYEDAQDMRRREVQENAAVIDLAKRWASERRPEEVALELAQYQREAQRIRHRNWPPRPQSLCRQLAEEVDQPALWLTAFLGQELRSDLVQPFLERTTRSRPLGWDKALQGYLHHESQAWSALQLVLKLQEPPVQLLEAALAKIAAFPQLAEDLCLRKEIPLPTLEALLAHQDPHVALAAAIGEWNAEPQRQVTMEIRDTWRHAILRSAQVNDQLVTTGSGGFGQWLGDILSTDGNLAFEWLNLFLDRDSGSTEIRGPVAKAVDALCEAHRLAIIESMGPGPLAYRLLPRLVCRKVAVYTGLLAFERLKDFHLRPLEGLPDEEWAGLARLALDAGFDPYEIARASLVGIHSYTGYGREYWVEWDRAFAELEVHSDEELRKIGHYGRQQAKENLRQAAAERRQHELHGI